MRADIISNQHGPDKQAELLVKYYGTLSAMDLRFPVSKDPSHINDLSFVWWDAFKTSKKEKQQNVNFERCAILFNLAALHSQVGIDQDRTTSGGLLAACKKFQEAAGVFAHIKDHVAMRMDAPQPLDVSPDSSRMLEQLMLAQAQECVFEKAMNEKKSEGVCARLGKQCMLFYQEVVQVSPSCRKRSFVPFPALTLLSLSLSLCGYVCVCVCVCREKIITGGPLGGHLEKSWLNHLRAKVLYFSAESELLMAEAEKKKDETNIGPQIARLRHADIKIKEAEKASKSANHFIAEATKTLSQLCDQRLRKAVKENETIYLESVPDYASIPQISEACMVKPTPPGDLAKVAADVFVGLVPDSSAKVVSKYTELVDALIKAEKAKLSGCQTENDQKMKELEVVGLLSALDAGSGDNLAHVLPETLRQKVAEVNSFGGVSHCFELAKELQGLRNVGTQMLNQAKQELEREASEDAAERERHGDKWAIPASATLTSTLTNSISDFRGKIQTARESDRSTLQQLEQPESPILLLETGTMVKKCPHLARPMVSVGAADPAAAAAALRAAATNLDGIQARGAQLEERLSETKFKDNILPQLMSSSDSEEKIFEEQLKKYEPLKASVAEICTAHTAAIANLVKAHSDFVSCYDLNEYRSQCTAYQTQISHALEVYKQIQSNFEKGVSFYTSLQDAIEGLKMQCGDFCLTRKMQRDDYSRQLAYAGHQQQQQQQYQQAAQQYQQQYQQPPPPQQQHQQQHYPPQQQYQQPPQHQGYPPAAAGYTQPPQPQHPGYPPVLNQQMPPPQQAYPQQQHYGLGQATAQMGQMHVSPAQYPPQQTYPPPPPPQG